ncbi:MAG: hypothetical protein WA040_25480 [Anaerolineae bacterium]
MSKKPAHLSVSLKQVALIAGIAALALFLFGYTSRLIASGELRDEVALWEQEVELEAQRVQASQERLAYVQSDRYVIDKAHTDLGWAFPNEVAVWVLGEEAAQPDTAFSVEGEPLANWQQWQQRFLGDKTLGR